MQETRLDSSFDFDDDITLPYAARELKPWSESSPEYHEFKKALASKPRYTYYELRGLKESTFRIKLFVLTIFLLLLSFVLFQVFLK